MKEPFFLLGASTAEVSFSRAPSDWLRDLVAGNGWVDWHADHPHATQGFERDYAARILRERP